MEDPMPPPTSPAAQILSPSGIVSVPSYRSSLILNCLPAML